MAKAPPPIEECSTCKHFMAGELPPWGGICRRFPPSVVTEPRADRVPIPSGARSAYPLVERTGTCGEWTRL